MRSLVAVAAIQVDPAHLPLALQSSRTLVPKEFRDKVRLVHAERTPARLLVVFGFLGTVRATIIPSIAVPLSLIGTFGVMCLLGYSLDNLSLMALAISTGFVVEDAMSRPLSWRSTCPWYPRKLHPPHHDSFHHSLGRCWALLALKITHNELNVIGLIGIILLIVHTTSISNQNLEYIS